MSVPASVVLTHKGREVHTVQPGVSLSEAARALAEHDVGALVVSGDGRGVEGIVSERDIVRVLGRDGGADLGQLVADVMQAEVVTCTPDTTVDELMAMMTEGRFRHVPVLSDGALVGIVSIGDVVRARLDELEVQTDALERYVTGQPS